MAGLDCFHSPFKFALWTCLILKFLWHDYSWMCSAIFFNCSHLTFNFWLMAVIALNALKLEPCIYQEPSLTGCIIYRLHFIIYNDFFCYLSFLWMIMLNNWVTIALSGNYLHSWPHISSRLASLNSKHLTEHSWPPFFIRTFMIFTSLFLCVVQHWGNMFICPNADDIFHLLTAPSQPF